MDTNRLRMMAKAVFLATDEKVAQDLSDKLKGTASEIDRLRTELSVAERALEETEMPWSRGK